MAHFGADKFAGKTQRVKLLIDQKVKGIGMPKGSTVDLSESDARYLKSIERVEFVSADEAVKDKPVAATR